MKIVYRCIAAMLAFVLRVALLIRGNRIGESTRLEIIQVLEEYQVKIHG